MTVDTGVIRTRMRDPDLIATPAADPATVWATFEFVAWASVRLLVGTSIGLITSIKLHWPEFLPYAWLSFGRVRPAVPSSRPPALVRDLPMDRPYGRPSRAC